MVIRILLVVLALVVLRPEGAAAWCVGGAPPALDGDDDGLNEIQEEFFGTDKDDADTDDDGVVDGLEDSNGDGIVDQDEPHVFSIETFNDPFADGRGRRVGLVLEGTNIFRLVQRLSRVDVLAPEVGETFDVVLRRPLNHEVRVYLRLKRRSFEALRGFINLRVGDRTTNGFTEIPSLAECRPRTKPHLMAAAVITLRTQLGDERRELNYLAIGGCNLLDRRGNRARTTVRLADRDIVLRAPYGGIGLLPSRVMIPIASPAVDASDSPFPSRIEAGEFVSIVTSRGTTDPIMIKPVLAQLRIPRANLDEDHDRDGLRTIDELALGTDPLLFDTDGDGLGDRREVRSKRYDPRDTDSNDDGIDDRRDVERRRREAVRLTARCDRTCTP